MITFLGYDITIGLSNSIVYVPGTLRVEASEVLTNLVVDGNVDVVGTSNLGTTYIGTSQVPKNLTVRGLLDTTGVATLSGGVTTSSIACSNIFASGTGNFNALAISNSVSIGSNLVVTGDIAASAIDCNSSLFVTNNLTVGSDINCGSEVQGSVGIFERVRSASGTINMTTTFQNIYKIDDGVGIFCFLLFVSTGASDGTVTLQFVVRDGDYSSSQIGNNIGVTYVQNTGYVQIRCFANSYANTNWHILRID